MEEGEMEEGEMEEGDHTGMSLPIWSFPMIFRSGNSDLMGSSSGISVLKMSAVRLRTTSLGGERKGEGTKGDSDGVEGEGEKGRGRRGGGEGEAEKGRERRGGGEGKGEKGRGRRRGREGEE